MPLKHTLKQKGRCDMDNGIKICCICGKKFSGWGNNPDPITDKDGNLFPENARCCDECNGMYVIPARIVALSNSNKGEG